MIHTALVALLGLALAAGAQAQQLSISSEPAALARAALGGEAGAASVAVWREGRQSVATLRRAPDVGASALLMPAEPLPLHEIGSISKVFTGLLLAQAVEKGDLGLDDNLGQLLRGKVEFSSGEVAGITLRQLVTHSSCLPRQFGELRNGSAIVAQIRSTSRAALLAALASQKLPHKGPCPALYSNYGMAMVGELLSQRYGRPWNELVRDNITLPLGMADTVQHLGDKAARFSSGFDGRLSAPAWDMDAFAGAGALRSTASDLVLFGRAILAGRNGPLGTAAERLVTPLGSYRGGEIGYAIFVSGPPSRRTYSHDGQTGGFQALLSLSADTGEVMAVLVSNRQAPMWDMAREVSASRFPVSNQAITLAPEKLRAYAGIYRVDPELAFICVVQDGQLLVRSTRNIFRAYIAVASDVFTRPAGGVQLTFVRQHDGIVALRLEQGGNTTDAQRTLEAVPLQPLLSAELARAYAGRYVATRFLAPPIEFDVRVDGGQMLVKGGNYPRVPTFPIPGQLDRFRYENAPAELQFERDAGGQATALVLHENGALRALKVADAP